MNQIFNKLVRDKIPNKIQNNGEKPFIKILDEVEYEKALLDKLFEECNEVVSAKSREDVLEELADLAELIISIAKLHNSSLDDVLELATIKREKRGGFEKRIFLEKVESEENQ